MGPEIKKKSYPDGIVFDDNSSENLHLLLETLEGINRTMELKSLLSESMEAARLVMNSEASSLMLLDQDTGELYISLPTGPVKDEITGMRIPKNEGIGGWVVEHKQPYFTNDMKGSGFFWGEVADSFTTRNIVCVPLINKKDKVIGVLQALNKRNEEPFTPRDIPVFQALASHVTIAIERAREQEELYNRLKEREVLLTEIHHRIKNNLATISALIELEVKNVDDSHAKHILENTHSRLRSMTEVHDLLCSKGLVDNIELGIYLNKLADKISETLSDPERQINIYLNADAVQISADKAMICGLVLNELLVNIYKHAFDDFRQGNITISLINVDDKNVRLEVADDGAGIPEGFDLGNTSSIGTWVINVLLNKLNANVDINSDGGTSFSIEFQK